MSDLQRFENLTTESAPAPNGWEVLLLALKKSEKTTRTTFLQMLVLCVLLVNPDDKSLRKLNEAALFNKLTVKAKVSAHKIDTEERHLIAILHCILDLAGNKFSDVSGLDDIDYGLTFAENLRLCGQLLGVQLLGNGSCRIEFADNIKLLREEQTCLADVAKTLEFLATISAFSQGHTLHHLLKLLEDLQSVEILLPFQNLADIPSQLTVHLNPYEASELEVFVTETKKCRIFVASEWGSWTFLIWATCANLSLNSEMVEWILNSEVLQTLRKVAMQEERKAPQLVGIILAVVSLYQHLRVLRSYKTYKTTCDCQVCAFDGWLSGNHVVPPDFVNDMTFALRQAVHQTLKKKARFYFKIPMLKYWKQSNLEKPDDRLVEYFIDRMHGLDHPSTKKKWCVGGGYSMIPKPFCVRALKEMGWCLYSVPTLHPAVTEEDANVFKALRSLPIPDEAKIKQWTDFLKINFREPHHQFNNRGDHWAGGVLVTQEHMACQRIRRIVMGTLTFDWMAMDPSDRKYNVPVNNKICGHKECVDDGQYGGIHEPES
ncbi:hypothetical protein CT0861_05065 [Colletotrichum tofieldiae]|uniref:Uncharacterized protein n=1 Tax=Colletotrichum tofieldiae TaxID=708197 RepID=A0A166MDA7_9PEZI|nr:hypothetical protein CT0861_05065 [Colletotrichum tofieldiae]